MKVVTRKDFVSAVLNQPRSREEYLASVQESFSPEARQFCQERIPSTQKEVSGEQAYNLIRDYVLSQQGPPTFVEPLRFNSRPINFEIDTSRCVYQ